MPKSTAGAPGKGRRSGGLVLCWCGTYKLRQMEPRVDALVVAALRPETQMICAEALTNSTLKLCGLTQVGELTHVSIPAERWAQLGIGDNLVHLSVGIKHVEDLRCDLQQALLAIAP